MVEWLKQLDMFSESRGFESRLEKFLCQPSSKWVHFYEQGKDKEANGA